MIGRVGVSRLSLVGGILVVIVGIVHTIATPMVHQGLSGVIGEKALGAAYFFATVGGYVILAGWLMIYCSRGLARGERWAWLISVVNGRASLPCLSRTSGWRSPTRYHRERVRGRDPHGDPTQLSDGISCHGQDRHVTQRPGASDQRS